MSSDPVIERAFWTPVIVAELDEAGAINPALEAAILARRGKPGMRGSNRGGWQSDKKLLDWGGEAARALRDRAIAIAEAHVRDNEAARPGRARGWKCEGWANLSGDGGYNDPHCHGGTYWTAVYYVRADPGEGGELVLHDPRLPAIAMHAPTLRFEPNGGEVAINLPPEPGLLVMFPSFIVHSVAPYRGEGLRISISINLSARFGAAARGDPDVLIAAGTRG